MWAFFFFFVSARVDDSQKCISDTNISHLWQHLCCVTCCFYACGFIGDTMMNLKLCVSYSVDSFLRDALWELLGCFIEHVFFALNGFFFCFYDFTNAFKDYLYTYALFVPSYFFSFLKIKIKKWTAEQSCLPFGGHMGQKLGLCRPVEWTGGLTLPAKTQPLTHTHHHPVPSPVTARARVQGGGGETPAQKKRKKKRKKITRNLKTRRLED